MEPTANFNRGATFTAHQRRRHGMLRRLAVGLSGKALDYGCGYGDVTHAFSKSMDIRGVDVDSERVHFARQQYVDIHFDVCDPEQTHFALEEFDVVISSVVVPFVPDPHRYLGEIWRILKPGGSLVIASKNFDVVRNAVRALLRKPPAASRLHIMTADDLQSLLINLGFRIVKSDHFYDPLFSSRKNLADACFGIVRNMGSLFGVTSLAEYYGFLAVKERVNL